jgi:CHAD domain-containing protein
MSYRLSLAAPVPGALRAAAAEQLEDAARGLRNPGDDLEGAVHSARKDLKKTRSLLRLAQPGMPGKAYRSENGRLRDIAQSISGARDADVMLATFAERSVGRVPEQAIAALHAQLAEAAARAPSGGGSSVPDDVVPALEVAIEGVATWPLDGCDRATLIAGAARAYRRGKRGLKVAAHDPSVENMHEWRKRAKDLWHAAQILRLADPKRLKAVGRDAHRLSDLLGDDHDLAVLATHAARRMTPSQPDAPALLEMLIARRRAELQKQALRCGKKLYALSPADFTKPIARGWRRRMSPAARPAGEPA